MALVTESVAPPVLEPMLTEPTANEFVGLLAVAFRFDQVAALASKAHRASTVAVKASLTAIRPVWRRFSPPSRTTNEVPAAVRSGTSRVNLNLIGWNGCVGQVQPADSACREEAVVDAG